ncbi:putative carboxypeptidase YodJ [Clostridiales bacterium]|nr:putative carboxypeptidase YodJ [Clostridiales bacterium]
MKKFFAAASAALLASALLVSCAEEPKNGLGRDTTPVQNGSTPDTGTVSDDSSVQGGNAVNEQSASIPVGGYKDLSVPASGGKNQTIRWTSSDESIASVDDSGRIYGNKAGECVISADFDGEENGFFIMNVTVSDCTNAQGLTYINGVLVVNKTYSLPSNYNPGVDDEANAALQKMFSAAKADGITLEIVSGFRSYDRQTQLYNNYVSRDGVAAADRYSARAGHSEHQTGLAFDLNSLEESFGETKEGKWLKEHCHEYGFIIRYPKEKEEITGYMYEPWHVRYLGEAVAKSVTESGLCLEEYLNVTSAYRGVEKKGQ